MEGLNYQCLYGGRTKNGKSRSTAEMQNNFMAVKFAMILAWIERCALACPKKSSVASFCVKVTYVIS